MALQVYSTLTRKKEPFHKRPGEAVSMYVCGPTVYKPSHIGHMVGPVIFDTVKRYLTYLGYKVTWVVNITDVDDKLINRARELKTTVPELACRMADDYLDCLKALNVTGVDHFPKATEHVGGMIEVIQKLEEKGYAYQLGDGVYFDVARDADYGKLSNRDPEQMIVGERLEPNARKRNPGDFALWKGAKPDEPPEVQYESPFRCGRGRPGWHIECTCMAVRMLGETLDIHGGGLDLQFPHHENELAQSESWTDQPFARVWMHNGLLKMGKEKMAGSVGNVVNIADLLKRHSAETVRFLLLSSHYRSPIEYSEERLDEIAKSLQAFYRFFERYQRVYGGDFYSLPIRKGYVALDGAELAHWPENPLPTFYHLREVFIAWMNDDFNTGAAIGVLHDLLKELNKLADDLKLEDSGKKHDGHTAFHRGVEVLRELSYMLGLFWEPPAKQALGTVIAGSGTAQGTATAVGVGAADIQLGDMTIPLKGQALEHWNRLQDRLGGLVQLLLDLRDNLRTAAKGAAKDNPLKKSLFDQTDLIRKRLGELGVTLEDRPGGTTWRVG